MIAAGIISGVFRDIPHGVECFAAYWEWHALNISSNVGAMQKAIADFLKERSSHTESLNQQLGLDLRLEIKCEDVKSHLDDLSRKGALEGYPTPQNVTEVMTVLGWSRAVGSDGCWCWIPTK
jgi:hypothetical protein